MSLPLNKTLPVSHPVVFTHALGLNEVDVAYVSKNPLESFKHQCLITALAEAGWKCEETVG